MIIAISSPPPVDTSELAAELAGKYGLRVVVDPAPALCKEYGFQTLYDMPRELQAEIRERLICEHADQAMSSDALLFNFSVFEYLADWMRWFWSDTPTEKWDAILATAAKAIAKYDEIYHVDSGKSLEYDGYIWFDSRNTSQIDGLLKGLYADLKVTDKLKKV
ncbi:MAG TPA: hypothetical protein VGI80_02200 [Pyrinomonadaceae bacterium]|jgi:hypothetical protein